VETSTIDVMTRAAVDCAVKVRDRFDGEWIVAGVRFGASVAPLAAAELASSRVLLISPELDPGLYFEGLRRRARRASVAYPGSDGLVFSVPLPEMVIRAAAERAADVRAAVSSADGGVTLIRYSSENRDGGEETGVRSIAVEGDGQWLTRDRHSPILAAAEQWLTETVGPQ
jgi:hypothetical protein